MSRQKEIIWNKERLVVVVGVEDIKFGPRAYRTVVNAFGKIPEEIDPNRRTKIRREGGWEIGVQKSINGLALYHLSPIFNLCGIKDIHEIDIFPIHNLGAEYFNKSHRSFDGEEMSYLRNRIHYHVNNTF